MAKQFESGLSVHVQAMAARSWIKGDLSLKNFLALVDQLGFEQKVPVAPIGVTTVELKIVLGKFPHGEMEFRGTDYGVKVHGLEDPHSTRCQQELEIGQKIREPTHGKMGQDIANAEDTSKLLFRQNTNGFQVQNGELPLGMIALSLSNHVGVQIYAQALASRSHQTATVGTGPTAYIQEPSLSGQPAVKEIQNWLTEWKDRFIVTGKFSIEGHVQQSFMFYIGYIVITSLGGFPRPVNSKSWPGACLIRRLMMFPFKKILCPTDFSEASLCGIKMGNDMADKYGSEIIIVNVHKPIPKLPKPRIETSEVTFDITTYENEVIKDAKENLATLSSTVISENITPKLVVRLGRPAEEILKVAEEEDVDAICIATHGRTGLAHIVFGSVAEKVVRRAHCVVVTVPLCD